MKERLREILTESLSSEDLTKISGSYDIVGDIAIIRLSTLKNSQIIADAIMNIHRNVKSVLAQTGPVSGDFRLRRLTHIAGKNVKSTIHRESGCLFSVNMERCYFSPRLSHERSRIASLVKPGETIVNMFAGVGCFSIIIAKRVAAVRVFSIDVNPTAIRFLTENVRLNRVYGKVIPILGDSGEVVESRLRHEADRVLMPLPAKSLAYLPSALLALKPSGGWVHYYDFEHARKSENPIDKTKSKMAEKLARLCVPCEFPFSRVVRTVGPNWYQVVLDIHVQRSPDKF
jgi:tRNA (guanine37-N1)-methyltransferase